MPITEVDIEKLRTDMANLRAELIKLLMEGERGQRNLIFGTYALIIIGIFANHFWK